MQGFRWLPLLAVLAAGCNDSNLAPVEKPPSPTPTATLPPGQVAPIAVIAGGSFFSPGQTATFDGSGSSDPDGTIVSFTWSLTARPAGSAATAAPNGATTDIALDVVGDYTINLTVTDDDGLTADAEVTFGVAAATGLRVELAWPGTYGQLDLDLHVVDQSAGGGYHDLTRSCFWYNCIPSSAYAHPDWGVTGSTADDPGLDGDNVNQAVPENIVIDDPADGTYRVLVHYFPRPGPDLPSTLTLKVFNGTTEIWSGNKTLPKDKDLWTAVDVAWSGSTATVTVIDSVQSNVQ